MIDWWRYGAKEKLEPLVKGRESSSDWVEEGRLGNVSVAKIKIYIQENAPSLSQYQGDSVELTVHADTRCDALKRFLDNASNEQLGIVEGPEGGHRLGLDGKYDSHLNIFVVKKRPNE